MKFDEKQQQETSQSICIRIYFLPCQKRNTGEERYFKI